MTVMNPAETMRIVREDFDLAGRSPVNLNGTDLGGFAARCPVPRCERQLVVTIGEDGESVESVCEGGYNRSRIADELKFRREQLGTGTVAAPVVTFDDGGKMILPDVPVYNDRHGLCAWLTAVFALDGRYPIIGGAREGLRGAAGHAVLTRMGAPPIRFEPVSRINAPARVVEDLAWQTIGTDAAVPAFKAEHARQIAHVVRMLCGATEALSDADETTGMIAMFLAGALAVEDHTTFGTAAERFEATKRLQRDIEPLSGFVTGPPRYLIDSSTGELVIRVSDLHEAARRYIGGSLARGWVDARMQNLGWSRVRLQGYGLSGREGRSTGPHARVDVYRGVLPSLDEKEPVNT